MAVVSPFFGIEVRDGQYVVYETTDGIHRTYLPRAVFGSPRKAIAYADMRQQAISPLRAPGEAGTPSPASPGALTGAGK